MCKDHFSASQPTFYCFECQDKGARFILPWERHRLNTTKLFGTVLEEQDVIVTGRPMMDEERTKLWMARYCIKTDVFLRDDQILYPPKKTTAEWKGKKALHLGCTRYVESEAQQAVHIAMLYPELQVVWWNAGEPVLIQATSRLNERNVRDGALL
ncbi:hypothetical protein SAMN04487897_102526 [Paenibacillus sp. yr247]|uniref:hypothetical protein n=1 Tax=Paenibacillus sp. yr247 TaxID=1761880 RepID=UPI000880C535|nr:hypothetical protein [Paenibacillus sp. yr247]SDN32939.1 hypothetical protein SAMN04487897_102526 [Paenibacillus sp. yr247]